MRIKTEITAGTYTSKFKKVKPVYTPSNVRSLGNDLVGFMRTGVQSGVNKFSFNGLKFAGCNLVGYTISYKDTDGTNYKVEQSLIGDDEK